MGPGGPYNQQQMSNQKKFMKMNQQQTKALMTNMDSDQMGTLSQLAGNQSIGGQSLNVRRIGES